MRILTILLLCLTLTQTAISKPRKAAQRPVRINCIGNSITYGIGVTNRDSLSYPAQLQRLLGEGYEVQAFGLSGSTLLRKGYRPYMGSKEYREAMARPCDIAIIHLGVNDTDPRAWTLYQEEFVGDYLALIDSVRRYSPGCRIILGEITPITQGHRRFQSGTLDWQIEIRRQIKTVAEVAGCETVDFFTELHKRPHLMPDNIHPNDEGCHWLALAAAQHITGRYGGLRLAEGWQSGMVLPRNKTLTLSGTADAGETVKASINGKTYATKAGANGRWQVELDALPTGGPYTLKVNDITLSDILAGEVWLCSGQSNMAFMLKESLTAAEDMPKANYPNIRLLNYKWRYPTNPRVYTQDELDSINALRLWNAAQWEPCTPETARDFSAIGYYFAQALHDSLGGNVPIGLVCNAIGGSTTEGWIDRNTLEHELPAILRDFAHNDFTMDWVRGRAQLNLGETDYERDGQGGRGGANSGFRYGNRHPYEPCYLYESSIDGLRGLPINGVLWYQGESNGNNIEAHEKLFDMLVRSWRETWQNPSMPFYYVQLSSLNRPTWCRFRDSQRRLLSCQPGLGMAVSSDLGDSTDVHPRYKRPMGERLARWVLHNEYMRKDITPSGPLYKKAWAEGNAMVVSFDYADRLRAEGDATRISYNKANPQDIVGFELAEHDGVWYPAKAVVEGETIRLTAPEVAKPRLARYGWQPFTRANLVNGAGLPASTFRN